MSMFRQKYELKFNRKCHQIANNVAEPPYVSNIQRGIRKQPLFNKDWHYHKRRHDAACFINYHEIKITSSDAWFITFWWFAPCK